jgi:hypothetical protein
MPNKATNMTLNNIFSSCFVTDVLLGDVLMIGSCCVLVITSLSRLFCTVKEGQKMFELFYE